MRRCAHTKRAADAALCLDELGADAGVSDGNHLHLEIKGALVSATNCFEKKENQLAAYVKSPCAYAHGFLPF